MTIITRDGEWHWKGSNNLMALKSARKEDVPLRTV